ncbi:MAG: LptE family protein [Siphonobacter sp.]
MKLMKNNRTIRKNWQLIFSLLFTLVGINGCGSYSFSPGGKLSSDLKTISINNFVVNAAGGPTNLSADFTNRLKEYFQRNTNLSLKPGGDGDLVLEGSIIGYDVTPQAPTSSDKAALNRLTVTVQVRFSNNRNEASNFEQSFSFFKDFSQTQTLDQVESSLVPLILDQIVLDIFSKTAGDW